MHQEIETLTTKWGEQSVMLGAVSGFYIPASAVLHEGRHLSATMRLSRKNEAGAWENPIRTINIDMTELQLIETHLKSEFPSIKVDGNFSVTGEICIVNADFVLQNVRVHKALYTTKQSHTINFMGSPITIEKMVVIHNQESKIEVAKNGDIFRMRHNSTEQLKMSVAEFILHLRNAHKAQHSVTHGGKSIFPPMKHGFLLEVAEELELFVQQVKKRITL